MQKTKKIKKKKKKTGIRKDQMETEDLCSLLIVNSADGNLENVKLIVQTIKKLKLNKQKNKSVK